MNNPVEALLRKVVEQNEAEILALREATAQVRKEAAEFTNEGERRAWETIVARADKLVQKDSSLSQAGAVERYLRTPQGKIDYQRYLEAADSRRVVLQKSAESRADRDIKDWALDQYFDVIAKAQDAGYTPEQAEHFAAQRLEPNVVRIAKEAGAEASW